MGTPIRPSSLTGRGFPPGSSTRRRTDQSTDVRSPRAGAGIPQAALHQEIARRAFELFLARGGVHGHDLDDWFQAEREVIAEIWRGRVA